MTLGGGPQQGSGPQHASSPTIGSRHGGTVVRGNAVVRPGAPNSAAGAEAGLQPQQQHHVAGGPSAPLTLPSGGGTASAD